MLSHRVTGTRIHLITRWHSLFPTSQSRISLGFPHGWLSHLSGRDTGFPRFASQVHVGSDVCCRPRDVSGHEKLSGDISSDPFCHFGSGVTITFACSPSRSLHRFTYVHLYQLPSITLVMITRRKILSRFPSCLTASHIVPTALYSSG